jgi:spore germination protein KB
MKNEAISERQGIILIILFILGNSLLIGSGGQAKQDAWIAIIISILWSGILLLMFSRILSLNPGKDLFDILEIVMGKFIGKAISILMIWFAFHSGTLVLRVLSDYTNTLVFPDTPVVVPMVFFTILLIWGLKAGIEVLGRWAEFFIWIVILLILFLTALLIPQMNINRLRPMLYNGMTPILKGAFSSFSFPFGQIVIFTMVFSNVSKVKNFKKIFLVGLLLGGGLLLLGALRNILVLGHEGIARTYFPSNLVVSLISVGSIFQRFEMNVSIVFLVCVFIKVSICIFAVCNGISKVFGFADFKFTATPVAFLMLTFSIFIYKNTMETQFFAQNIWQYYSFLFEVIIPFVIFIVVEIKYKRLSSLNTIK